MSEACINKVASDWVVKASYGPFGEDDRIALNQWLAQDARHRGAYERAHAILIGMSQMPEDFAEESAASNDDEFEEPSGLRQTAGRWMAPAVGGSIAACLALVLFLFNGSPAQPAPELIAFQTGPGEVKELTLVDGSTVYMNTRSALEISYGPETRALTLTSGEAFFDVQPDKSRPFVVTAGDVSVRAVGTSFSVASTPADRTVVVREGLVAIAASESHPVRIAANMKMRIAANGHQQVESFTSEDIERSLLWRSGRISFDGATLNDAVAAFVDHNDAMRFDVSAEAGRLQVSGVFSLGDPLGFADAAAIAHDLEMERSGNVIHLRK